MRKDKVIYLISSTITRDEVGNQVETTSERKVFARELAVGATEFYNAALNGLRPTIKFEVYTREYRDEIKLKYNGQVYRVTRPQVVGNDTRLSCERVGADG